MDLKTYVHSLPCPPPSFLSLNYKCPPTLGSGEPWTQGGMRGFHLLFINTGSGNTPHCQPNPLSLRLVPWQRGVAVTRYRAPDVPWMRGEDDRVFTPSQLWMHADEDRVGWGGCNGTYWRDPCYCSRRVVCLSSAFPLLSCIISPFFLYLSFCFLSAFFQLLDSPFSSSVQLQLINLLPVSLFCSICIFLFV